MIENVNPTTGPEMTVRTAIVMPEFMDIGKQRTIEQHEFREEGDSITHVIDGKIRAVIQLADWPAYCKANPQAAKAAGNIPE